MLRLRAGRDARAGVCETGGKGEKGIQGIGKSISDCGFWIADFKKTENRDYPVGVAFPVLSLSKGSHDLAISTASTVSTIYCLPFTVYEFPVDELTI